MTSSEEAGTIDSRIEPKGKGFYGHRNSSGISEFHFCALYIGDINIVLCDCDFAEELGSTRLAPPIISSVSSEYVSHFSILPTENIYEFAAKLLFFAVRWARSIHSFLQVSGDSQKCVNVVNIPLRSRRFSILLSLPWKCLFEVFQTLRFLGMLSMTLIVGIGFVIPMYSEKNTPRTTGGTRTYDLRIRSATCQPSCQCHRSRSSEVSYSGSPLIVVPDPAL